MEDTQGNASRRNGNDGRAYWERTAKAYDLSLALLARPFPRMRRLTAGALHGCRRVLEVAAGTGALTSAIAQVAEHVVSTDYADAMVERLRDYVTRVGLSNVEVARQDVYDLPYADRSFDGVAAANVLHLLPDLEGALAALKRVVRPGGYFALPTFVHAETRLSRITSEVLGRTGFPQQRRFTTRSLVRAVGASGLYVERVETLPGLIPVAFVSARRLP
jgi:ubiquinone/menaquinone biosynthesis C-methylase UbiE